MIHNIDWLVLIVVFVLCAISLLAIANAKAVPYTGTETGIFAILESIDAQYVILQSIWIALGLAIMIGILLLDYRFFGELWFYIYIVNIVLLVMVLFLSKSIGGVNAWFSFKIGDSLRMFQPAEICKIAIIISLAKLMSRGDGKITHIKQLLPILLYFAIPLVLVVWQGELGSVMVYLSIFIGMLFLAGAGWKLLVGLFTTGILSLVPLWFLIGSWRQERILSFLNPTSAMDATVYQVEMSKLAIGSGRMMGKGLFQEGSFSQLDYVPVKLSDFIFSVTAEAVGFVGCMVIVLLYLFLIIRLYILSSKTVDRFGGLIIAGVASMFLFQVFENIAMTMGIMPVTGIPLPFMSYGGSAMITNFAAIALVINVGMRPQKAYL